MLETIISLFYFILSYLKYQYSVLYIKITKISCGVNKNRKVSNQTFIKAPAYISI